MSKRIISVLLMILIISLPSMVYAQSSGSDVIIDETVLEPKDPILATVIAIGPGLLVHGVGNYYSENYKMGLLLTGLEIVSIGTMAFGFIENTQPDMLTVYGQGARRGGAVTFGVGFVLFMGTWLADVFLAGSSAQQYNLEHNLEFKMQQESLLDGNANNTFAAIYNFKF